MPGSVIGLGWNAFSKEVKVTTTLGSRKNMVVEREAAGSRHEQVCTYLVVPARGGDMSPPYRGFHGNDKAGSLSCHCEERSDAAISCAYHNKRRLKG